MCHIFVLILLNILCNIIKCIDFTLNKHVDILFIVLFDSLKEYF